MAHDAHFLSRLDRISLAETEIALSLYNDAGLVRAILADARIPESAERIAIALGDNGPYVLVARNGHFVTCLAKGMGVRDLPLVTRPQLDGISARITDLRARLDAAAHATERAGGYARLLRKIGHAADGLSREDFLGISVLQPVLADSIAITLMQLGPDLEALRTRIVTEGRRGRVPDEWLETWWRGAWAVGHLSMLAGHDGGEWLDDFDPALSDIEGLLSWPATSVRVVTIAMRGAWSVARVGKPLVAPYKKYFADTQLGTIDRYDAGLGLLCIAARRERLRAEMLKFFERPLEDPNDFGVLFAGLLEFPDIRDASGRATLVDAGREKCFRHWRGKEIAGTRIEAIDDVPEDIAITAALNVSGDPFIGRREMAMTAIYAAIASRLPPESFYFPADVLPAARVAYEPATVLGYLRATELPAAVREPVRRAAVPGRNEPCMCGSGKKYKRCCGR